jgi:LAO/AO transport system kinase
LANSKKHKSTFNEIDGLRQPPSVSDSSVQNLKKNRKLSGTKTPLLVDILDGNKTALSRAITLIESRAKKHQDQARELINQCLPFANQSIRIGITGVPGVGKSTFIESFGQLVVSKGHKLAILAVDPSSSISGGSILGDKTRMEELVKESNAFIRPTPSRESFGGVAQKTREAIILCEAAGYDIIIIETVGVGQSEITVHSMTDFFLLLKLAGAGDELQGIKRGIMEMADVIAINKADGDNLKAAKLAKTEFNRALHLYSPKIDGWIPKTLICSAIKNEGIDEILTEIMEYIDHSKKKGHFDHKRTDQNKFWLMETIESNLKNEFYSDTAIKKEIEIQLKAIESQKITAFTAAQIIFEKAKGR